jgi:RNA-dependent RNA polymerase
MGNFSHISVVARYAARLGQCFSTTRAINGLVRPDIVEIPDIKRNGYCFTDGVGKISPFLAQMIAAELGLRIDIAPAPSAFQFRLGGCKGILVVSPDAKDKEVHIRRSQEKFTATYNGLEIIRCSRFCCATLNRQTITILSSLGVRDEVLLKMLSEQLSNYQDAMSNNTLALSLLSRYIDDNRMTISIASMILNGFMTESEPFVLSLLDLWRAWSIKLLKEKARLIVENGAFVLGCVDEKEILRGYTRPATGETLTKEHLPQIFIQVPDKNDPNQYNVVEGICLVGRNPSLHPGDLRVVQAVNVPALHHLRNVVVFPQTGERDVPSMCSGGDLDGDDYFVIWDEALLPQPREWNCDPMSYAAPAPKALRRPVEVADLKKFFVKYMKNDALPTIAHAHLAQADYLYHSIKDPKCTYLRYSIRSFRYLVYIS